MSLRTLLILPYVVLIILLTLTISLLSYWAASQTVAAISDHALRETVGRISQAVDRHVYGSGAVLEAAFPDGLPAPPNIEPEQASLRTRFWIATSLHTDPNNYVYYGNNAGQGFGLMRLSGQEGELRTKFRAEDHRRYSHFTGIDGPLRYSHTEKTLFDPRERPWYQLAQSSDHHMWTAVYINFGTDDLVVTRARRVLSSDDQFAGVVATDVSLRALNTFIARLKISDNGRAFLVEPGGDLIAATGTPNVRKLDDGTAARVSALSSHDPLIQATYQAVNEKLTPQNRSGTSHSFAFTSPDGQTIQVAMERVSDNAGLDWIAVVAVPRADLMAGVTGNLGRLLAAGLLAVAIAALIGSGIFTRVARDISLLSDAALRVGRGERNVNVQVSRKDEIGALARSFGQMQRDLFTDKLTGVANRDTLTRYLTALSETPDEALPGKPPELFGVLFIDLDRFKPINDQYGHDNGDRALIEIANRLHSAVRTDDLVARLGGDEFVVVLRHLASPEAAQAVRGKLEKVIQAPLTTLKNIPEGETIWLGASIGIALYPHDGLDADTLLKHADHAMYASKQAAAREGKYMR